MLIKFFKCFLALALTLYPVLAEAAAGTITVKDASAATQTFDVIVDGSGHFVGLTGVCDQAAAAQCATVTASNALKVDGSAVTQPVSAASLPLPTGAATSALQTTINTTLGSPFQAGGSIGNTTFAATQATAASLNATVVGTGTFATQSTVTQATASSLNATVVQGTAASLNATVVGTGTFVTQSTVTQATSSNLKAQVDPLTIATWGLMSGTTSGTAPTNTQIIGGIFNSAAPTPSTGNTLPLQLDGSGNLNVNIKAGAGSGGTAIQDQATFTQSTTSETPMGCLFNSGYASGTSGRSTVVSCTAAGSVHTTVDNATALGSAVSASSNPVVLATDQTAADACMFVNKTNVAIATSSGTVQLVAPSGSTQVYVCSFSLIAAAAAVVNLVGGTGASCTTGTPVAALGSTTAASGLSLAANGGLTFGNGGNTVARTTTAGHGLCLIQSGTTALAGNITYVQK